jgi:hypothetical protein
LPALLAAAESPAVSGSITLADVAERTDVLAVACTRCERADRYRLDALIKRHGRLCGIPTLLMKLSADCPKRESVPSYDLCGIYCPDLSELFLGKPG